MIAPLACVYTPPSPANRKAVPAICKCGHMESAHPRVGYSTPDGFTMTNARCTLCSCGGFVLRVPR